jgi:5-formyltetrahydrofolate cyclo-ligase
MPANKAALRRQLRQERQQLSPRQQRQAARKLYQNLNRSGLLNKHQRIGIYLANDGEISPNYFLPLLRKRKKKCYAPILDPINMTRMRFQLIGPSTRWVKNRFGITEPAYQPRFSSPARFISLILMPLVAFDASGNRLGMGGGFYDRAFSFKRNTSTDTPELVGIAHELQRQDRLDANDWDIPMTTVVTDHAIYAQ